MTIRQPADLQSKSLRALKQAREIILRCVEEGGGCDHSVGVCYCDEYAALSQIDEILMKQKGYVKTSVWIRPEYRRVLRDFVRQLNQRNA